MNKKNVRILRESAFPPSPFLVRVTGCSSKCYGKQGIKSSRFTVFECKCFDKDAVADSVRNVREALGQVRGKLNGLALGRGARTTFNVCVCVCVCYARALAFTQPV